jgi:hypothetical protein
MQEVVARQRVPAKRPEVWRVYTDHVSWTDWAGLGTVRLARQGNPAPNGTGCVRVISSYGISVHEEVLSFDPPERMTYRVVRGGLPMKNHLGEVRLADDGGATLIEWRCRFDSRIPGLGPVWRAIVGKIFRDTLLRLARYPFVRPV